MALPATITPATPLGSDLKSDGDNQIRALKDFIVDVFGVPANTPITTAPFSITAGGLVTVPQAMTLSSTLTVTGATTLSSTLSAVTKATINPGVSGVTPNSSYDELVIEGQAGVGMGLSLLSPASGLAAGIAWGDAANAAVATLNYTHSDGRLRILTEDQVFLNDAGVAHGMTALADNSTYLALHPNSGGGSVRGFSSSNTGLILQGYVGASNTIKGLTASAGLIFEGQKQSGVNITPLTTTENVAVIRSGPGGTVRHIFDASGDIHLDGVSNNNVFDDYDDIKLLTAARASLMPDCDFRARFSDWIEEYAPVLARGKIITYNDDGHHFVSYKGMQKLMIDAIRQLGERIECLEQPKQIDASGWTIKSAWKKLSQKLRPTFALVKVRL